MGAQSEVIVSEHMNCVLVVNPVHDVQEEQLTVEFRLVILNKHPPISITCKYAGTPVSQTIIVLDVLAACVPKSNRLLLAS